MFGKQNKKKIEEVPVEVPVEEEPTVDLVVDEPEPAVEEKTISPPDRTKQPIETKKEELENFMTVNAVELVGQGIYKYTLIATKPVWEIGTVLKL